MERHLARSILLPAAAACSSPSGYHWSGAPQAPEGPAIRISAQSPVGIAAAGGRLWVTDAGTAEMVELNPSTGDPIGKFKLAVTQPKGLAFDGQRLWVADQATRQIVAHDATDGKQVKAIPVRWPQERGFKTIEALGWDGTAPWTAIAAGFSSRFNQIDADSGQIVRSIFVDCNPRGLAFNAGGLLTLSFNGDKNPATVDQRQVAAQEADMGKTSLE